MSDEVQIFYVDLISRVSSIRNVTTSLVATSGLLYGDDVGIDNPMDRPSLRLEVRRRLTALSQTVGVRTAESSDLAATLQSIADRFSDLDVELSGRDQS